MSSHPDRPVSAAAAVVLVLAVLGSVDWIAYLALRAAGPAVCAAIIAALTKLVLALGRACAHLLNPPQADRGEGEDAKGQ